MRFRGWRRRIDLFFTRGGCGDVLGLEFALFGVLGQIVYGMMVGFWFGRIMLYMY